VQADLLASPATHAKLPPFQAIQAMYTLAAYRPALTTQHDHDSLVAKPWSCLGKITNAHP
jgi:hypothetical protein